MRFEWAGILTRPFAFKVQVPAGTTDTRRDSRVNRPPKSVLIVSAVVLAASVAGGLAAADSANWDLATAALLLVFAVVSEQMAVLVKSLRVSVSGSFLAIVVAMVLLGGAPAAAIGVLAGITGAIKDRKPGLIPPNAAIYASFPLACGAMFHWAKDSWSLQPHDV